MLIMDQAVRQALLETVIINYRGPTHMRPYLSMTHSSRLLLQVIPGEIGRWLYFPATTCREKMGAEEGQPSSTRVALVGTVPPHNR